MKKEKGIHSKEKQFLYALLISSALSGQAHGMMTDWPDLFDLDHRLGPVGSRTLVYLDNRSLGRASQVSHGWQQLTHQLRRDNLDLEKQQLYSLILEVTQAEPNEVQRAHDRLGHYLRNRKEHEQQEPLVQMFTALHSRLVQPESLIRSNSILHNHLLSTDKIQESDKALEPLIAFIKDLKNVFSQQNDEIIGKTLIPLIHHYEKYLKQLMALPIGDRAAYLHPKALLSGEGFLGYKKGVPSYRLSQEMARFLLSKSEYGLALRTNQFGSHAVSFKSRLNDNTQSVHFKGNTTNTGLAVARESAVYSLSQILFRRGMAASALLSLNEVEINTPRPGTLVNKAFTEALMMGQTSNDFFILHPRYEEEFTKKDPAHVVQASLHVEGVSLDSFIEGVENGRYSYDDLDVGSFSEHILMSTLTNPTDGTPGNFILRKESGAFSKRLSFSIVGIDNDMALEPGDVAMENIIPKPNEKRGTKIKHSVRVKNALLCLPLMDAPLALHVVKRILSLDPELMALEWLGFLKQQNEKYAQLQSSQYHSDHYDHQSKELQAYLSESHIADLHLPFLLNPEFIPELCQTLKNIQVYLQDHKAATHWQLLLNIHPLSSRFYQVMLEKGMNSVMKTYMSIDLRYKKNESGIGQKDVVYLEDVLSLEERLLNGQTVGEALNAVSTRPDGLKSLTQPVEDAAKDLLLKTDLFKQPSLREFMEIAISRFGHLIKASGSDFSLHESWSRDSLLLKAICEKMPVNVIKTLLEKRLDVSITDQERRTALRLAVEHEYLPSVLILLRDAYRGDHFAAWINSLASDRLTALDRALETKQIEVFEQLIKFGASKCNPNIAYKFYRDVIKGERAVLGKQSVSTQALLRQAFITLMHLNDEVRWHVCLHEMLPPYAAGQHGTCLSTTKFSERLLPNWVKSQILDLDNLWIPYTADGNHIVCRAIHPQTEHGLYFKVYPELPGIEEAVGLLTRMLLGYGAPHTELTNVKGIPVLISHSHGDKEKTLDFVLKKNPELLKDLDSESLSGLILVAMLINPEDGKPSNYVLEPHPTNPGQYRIVGIDNDHAFVPAIVQEKPSKELLSRKPIPIAQVKTILYCLDQMKDPVHPTIRNLFINLHPDEILDEWLRELKKVNNNYNDLFPNSKEQASFFKDHECVIGIPFQKGAISHLYDKFVTLRESLSKNPDITHIELLLKLEPRLAKRYQLALTQLSTVKQRWDEGDALFYETSKTGSQTTLTKSAAILKSMDIPLEESVLESIRKGKALGPIQALEELRQIRQELETKTLEGLGARAGDLNILKTLQLESTRAKFLDQTDFKDLSPQEQEAILSYLKGKQLRDLSLKNCTALNDTILTQALSLIHLHKLDLRGCEKITYHSLVTLSQAAAALEELNLSNIKSMKEIGDIGAFTDTPLVFKELRFLNLSNCINVVKILIQAPNLHYLNIENCILINDQMLDGVIEGSPDLQKLLFEGCLLIGEKEFREKCPNFPVNRLQNATDKTFVVQLLKSKATGLSVNPKNQSISVQACTKALKLKPSIVRLSFTDQDLTDVKIAYFSELQNLQYLDLGNNQLTNSGLKHLSGLTNLQHLDLSKNQLSGSNIRNIAKLTTLRELNLRGNALNKDIVADLKKIINLKNLNLASNYDSKIDVEKGIYFVKCDGIGYGPGYENKYLTNIIISDINSLKIWGASTFD